MKRTLPGLLVMALLMFDASLALARTNCIWFLGDSITQSNADGDANGSPRKSLYNLLVPAGYTFRYTGHSTANQDGLTNALYYYHSGVSGSVIATNVPGRTGMTQGITNGWWVGASLSTAKPDIIIIMLGANNINSDIERTNAPTQLSNMVDVIYARAGVGTPAIFLSNVTPIRTSPTVTSNQAVFNATVPGIAAAFRAQGKFVYFVDVFTDVNNNYAASMQGDNLHPNSNGNTRIAQQWFNAIDAEVGLSLHSPTGLTIEAYTNNRIELTWVAPALSTGFTIKRAESSGAETNIGTATSTNYSDTTVVLGTTYYYRIAATNSLETSADSAEVYIKAGSNTSKRMLTFVFPEFTNAVTIAGTNISVTVPYATAVASLAPTYMVSALATGTPASGATANFTTPQVYTVTAEDLSTTNYLVTVNFVPLVSNGGGASNIAAGVTQLRGNLNTNAIPSDIYIYWGRADGGTNKSGWENTNLMSSVPVGLFSNTVSNLTYGLKYYYRCYASNATDAAWAVATTNFTTLRLPSLMLTNLYASDQTTTSAVLNASLSCSGAVFDVSVYWNTINAGSNAALWTNSAYVGSWTNVTSTNLSRKVTGLNMAGTNYFTFRATNEVEDLWASGQHDMFVSSGKDMLTFDVSSTSGFISGTNILVAFSNGTDVTALAPVFTVSPLATVIPGSGTIRDFTTPQTYVVTAADGSRQAYVVTASWLVYIGDAAAEKRAVTAGNTVGDSVGILTYAFARAAESYQNTTLTAQVIRLIEVNYYSGSAGIGGNLIPFAAVYSGGPSNAGSAAGTNYTVLSTGDVIAVTTTNTLQNMQYLASGTNPAIALPPGAILVAGVGTTKSYVMRFNSSVSGINDYIRGGNSLPATLPGALTADSSYAFDRTMKFNIGIGLSPTNPSTALVPYTYTTNNGTVTITGYIGPGGAAAIPGTIDGLPVTSISGWAFFNAVSLTSVTLSASITNIGNGAFHSCTGLTGFYFKGNAPGFGLEAFTGVTGATIYYLSSTTGWGATFGGLPAVQWRPQVLWDASFGVLTNAFGFNSVWASASGMVIVVEACTDLANPIWFPLQTNTLSNDTFYFSDPHWTNYLNRFYRLH